jgi:hypothetical protein
MPAIIIKWLLAKYKRDEEDIEDRTFRIECFILFPCSVGRDDNIYDPMWYFHYGSFTRKGE